MGRRLSDLVRSFFPTNFRSPRSRRRVMSPTLRSIPALEQRLLLSGAAPYAGSGPVGTVVHGQPLSSSVSILCWDPESDPLIYSSGGVSMNPDGSFVYTSAAGVLGDVTISFSVFDGTSSADGSLTITVTNAVPDSPQYDGPMNTLHDRAILDSVAGNDGLTWDYNGPWISNGNGGMVYNGVWKDSDGDVVTFLQVTNATDGNAVLNPSTGVFTYTPNPGFVGQDSFTYKLSDGIGTGNSIATVTLNVTNNYPSALSDSYYAIYDLVVQGDLSDLYHDIPGQMDILTSDNNRGWVDADGDAVTFIKETDPFLEFVDLNPTTGAFTYQKPTGYYEGHETMYFTYRLSDGVPFPLMMTPSVATVTMVISFPFSAVDDVSCDDVDPVDGTVYHDVNYFVLQDNVLSISASQGVLKNDAEPQYVPYLTAEQEGNGEGQYGTFAIASSGAFTYTPFSWVFENPYFMGLTDWYQYRAKDAAGHLSAKATVFVALAKAVIEFNGEDIDTTNAAPDVWVGQPVPVSVSGIGIGTLYGPGTKFQWSIAGDTFKEYRIDDGLGRSDVIRLTAAELKKKAVTFHWVAEEGSQTVTVTLNPLLGQTKTLTKDIDVHRPQVTINAKTGNPGIAPQGDELGNSWLAFAGGVGTTNGIKFKAEGDISVGTFAWLQLIDMSANGIDGYTEGSGLDKEFPYQGDVGTIPPTAVDSPGVRITGEGAENLDSATYDGCFTMNLMWKSPIAGSEYVPLRALDWFVNLAAYKDNAGWHVDTTSTSASVFNWDQEGYDLTEHPTWDNVVDAP